MISDIKKRSLLIGISTLVLMTTSAFIYYRLRLNRIYKNINTVPEAVKDMQNPNIFFINTNEGAIQAADQELIKDPDSYQYSNGSDDTSSAPVIFNQNPVINN